MITSTSNGKVKYLVNLRKKKKLRDGEGLFLTEGIRMFKEVPADRLKEVYMSDSFYKKTGGKGARAVEELLGRAGVEPEILSDTVYQYVSDTRTPQGVMCLVERRERELPEMLKSPRPFLAVLDNLQDPGNLGTILRAAEAAGATGVVMSGDCVDIYNPKTIRSTMGSVYRVPFCHAQDLPEALGQMKRAGVRVYAAQLDAAADYDGEDYWEPCAFLIGNEGNGLRAETAAAADAYIRIPMCGEVESLNAAVAASVLLFEAARQRRAK